MQRVKRGEETKVEVVQCGKERRGEEERRRERRVEEMESRY